MKEDFLHYLWKYQKIDTNNLKNSEEENIQILNVGSHNTENSGPDFFNAQLIIGEQQWAGNVEIHVKASDWFAHNHQNDSNYNSVILHVVWEYDVDVFRKNNTKIPILELKNYVSESALKAYEKLYNETSKRWINCENQLENISEFTWKNWLERLYFERLNKKSLPVKETLKKLNNNWEATCFTILAKGFGGNKNGEAFYKIAQSIPFVIVQKITSEFQLEALLFGQANLLNSDHEDSYYKSLQKEYLYLKHKYNLKELIGLQVQFFKLRPPNFPTIRISQFANFYTKNSNVFQQLMRSEHTSGISKLLSVAASNYWDTHFTFDKKVAKRTKKTSASFIELLVINSTLPLKFIYQKSIDKFDAEIFVEFIKNIKSEKNTIISNYKKIGAPVNDAMDSQALLTLKKSYCEKKACLQCQIGYQLLNSKH